MGRGDRPVVVGGHRRTAGPPPGPGVRRRLLLGRPGSAGRGGPGRGRGAGRRRPGGTRRAGHRDGRNRTAGADRVRPAGEPGQRRQGRRPGPPVGGHHGVRQATRQRGPVPGGRGHRDPCGGGPDHLQRPGVRRGAGPDVSGRHRAVRRRRVRPGRRHGRGLRPSQAPRPHRCGLLAGRDDRRCRGHGVGGARPRRRRPPVSPRRHARRRRRGADVESDVGGLRRRDGGDLYITTSWVDCEQRDTQPLAGAIFRCRPGVFGRPSPRYADVPLLRAS